MIDLNGASNPPPRTFFAPTYLFGSNGVEKVIQSHGYHYQNSTADGDTFIIPIFCGGGENVVDLSWIKGTNKAIFDLYISRGGGAYVLDSSGYDGYAASSTSVTTTINISYPLYIGWNYLKLVINGRNVSNTTGYMLSIYGVRAR